MVIRRNKKRRKYRVRSESTLHRKAPIKLHRKKTEELLKRYDTVEKCQEYLFRWKWPEGYRCPGNGCGHHEYYYHKKRHLYQCKVCRHQTSLTKGTIFEKTRTSLSEWFKMIILIVQTLRPPSTRKIKEELGIESYDRALRMREKIEVVLSADTAYEQFVGIVEPHMLRRKKFGVKRLQERKERFLLNVWPAS